jgi:YidC/Oxa1 family membrane protein insertase
MMIQADVDVETNSLRLQFNDQGDWLRVEACFPDCQQSDAKTRVLSAQKGMFVLGSEASPGLQFERSREPSATILEWSDADTQVLRRWSVPDHGWVLSLTTQGADQAELSSGEDFRPAQSSGFGYLLEQTRYLVFDGEDVAVTGLDDDVQADHKASGWFGFRNRFWTAMIMPDADLMVRLATGEELSDAQVTVQLDSNMPQHMQLYLGPIEPLSLKRTAPELENLMYSGLWFWLRWICQALYYLLSGIVMVIPQWGPAVMVLSVIVGLLMRPLSKIADRLQDQVHEIDARLAPTLAAIKKDYKGAEQSEKIIAMYKEEGVHPLYSLKSLMGVFVVIPVFIGAFDMLAENIHLSGEAFLWISDLSNPDAFLQMPFSLPFFGGYLNLLPFIMTGFSFVASKLHAHPAMDAAQQRKQSRNLVLMSLGFLVLFYTFPAGMVLYWTTNNLISVIKMLWKRRKINAVSDQ